MNTKTKIKIKNGTDLEFKMSPKPMTKIPVAVKKKHKYYGFLPEHQRFAFQYCFFLHDQILSIIMDGEDQGIFSVSIPTKKDPKELKGAELKRWLNKNLGAISFSHFKTCTLALLNDFIAYVYEAINVSKKLKSQVSYALLRRPLKENLFYLEFMLAKPIYFLEQLYDEEQITPVDRVNKEDKIEIISICIDKYKNPFFYTPELIYDLRYRKDCLYGLEYLFQHSLHLITTFKDFKTEPMNFNFIFPGDSVYKHGELESIYTSLPLILLHTLYLVLELMGTFVQYEDGAVSRSLDARNKVGFILWYTSMRYSDFFEMADFVLSDEQLASLSPEEILTCNLCGHKMNASRRFLKKFYDTGRIKCSKCKNESYPYGEY